MVLRDLEELEKPCLHAAHKKDIVKARECLEGSNVAASGESHLSPVKGHYGCQMLRRTYCGAKASTRYISKDGKTGLAFANTNAKVKVLAMRLNGCFRECR